MYVVPSLVRFTRNFLTNITIAAVAATRNAPSTETAAIHVTVDEEDEGFESHFFVSSSRKMKEVGKNANKSKKTSGGIILMLYYIVMAI